jgi:hypothetical protein
MRLAIALLFLIAAIVIFPTAVLGILFILAIALLILAASFKLVAHYWDPQDEFAHPKRQLTIWACKGIIIPLIFWVLVNTGLSARYPPLITHEGRASRLVTALSAPSRSMRSTRSSAPTLLALLFSAVPVALVIASYWAATTFGWQVAALYLQTESRREAPGASIFWCLILSPVAALAIYVGGWGGIGLAALTWLVPITRELLAFGIPKKLPPLYADALAKTAKGKYRRAELAVLRELEKREDDFDGWMILAQLYAEKFHEIAEAERIIHQLCTQPTTTRAEMSLALNRLADWQLHLAKDPAAACRALEEICHCFPATHLADTARNRINQISTSSSSSSSASCPP